jgi:hypothetical protein
MAIVPVKTASNRAGYRSLQRRVGELLEIPPGRETTPSLESVSVSQPEPPRIASARLLEDKTLSTHPIPLSEPGFTAFVDGIQESRIAGYAGTVPIIHGIVGAVVRQRLDRRLTTWTHEFQARLYVPRAFLSRAIDDALSTVAAEIVDITPRRSDGEPETEARHPYAISETAVNAVRKNRESLECRLAEGWISEKHLPLYIDGGISNSAGLASSELAVGVIKSHRTLYADSGALETVLRLPAATRTSVFEVSSSNRWRAPVASWYLRLRDPEVSNPMHGLVRIEVAVADGQSLADRADRISAWVLAEATPLSLPDSRWDTMAYAIRDCEQFLKSLL